MKVDSLLTKQKNEDNNIVLESIDPYFIEELAKIFVTHKHFLEIEYTIFNADIVGVI